MSKPDQMDDNQVERVDSVESTQIEDKTAMVDKNGDIALNLASELDAGYELSPELEGRVRRKIDFILLPLITCTATLSFLDKVSNNYANNVSLNSPSTIILHVFVTNI